MNIGICDDEQIFRDELKNLVLEVRPEADVYEYGSGEELMDALRETSLDLLFLDCEMNGISGIEVKNLIESSARVGGIVFVSSFQNYVFSAFGSRTLGYVLKPATRTEIAHWITLVEDKLGDTQTLTLQANDTVLLRNVMYIRGDGSYSEVYVRGEDEPRFMTRRLGDMEDELKPFGFIRTHKSYIVNLGDIKSIDKDVHFVSTTDTVPVSRSRKKPLMDAYKEYVRIQAMKALNAKDAF